VILVFSGSLIGHFDNRGGPPAQAWHTGVGGESTCM